jgi:polar amino acid transport system substrate-binding protein
MKQIVRKGLKNVVVQEVPDPVVSPHHVLVRPHFSLISSGTETASLHQEGVMREVAHNPSHLRKIWDTAKVVGPQRTAEEVLAKFSEYAAIGYSGAGLIVEKHSSVVGLQLGERVAYGGEGTGHAETVHAGLNLVAKVPDAVSFEDACFTTLGAISLNAVRIASVNVGDIVAVIGLGLVGQLVAQLASAQGARVICIDLLPDRLTLARQLGAERTLLDGEATSGEIDALTGGRGVDCAIVAAAARSSAPCQRAIDICRDRGRIVVVGAVEMNLPRDEMYRKELQLFMSRAYGPGSYDASYEAQGRDYPYAYVRWTEQRNMEEFLRLLAAKRVHVQPLVTHQFPLEDAETAYATILDRSARSLAVLLKYPAASLPEPHIAFKPHRKIPVAVQPPTRSKLGVAVVGAGNLARWVHLPNLRKMPSVTLRAIHSSSGVRGKSYASRFGAAYCCTDYTEILADPEVDVVLIATRHEHHFSQALAALRAGKHVFLEKPMALTEEHCRILNCAVAETGKSFTVGFNRRFAPLYMKQRKELASRSSPAVVNCRVNSPGMSGSFWAADLSIGGAILSEACHFVDLMYWLIGAEPESVAAFCFPTGTQPIGENNMVASFRFVDGSIGNLTYCTVGSPTSAGERVDVYAQGIAVTTEDFKRLTRYGRIRRRQSRLWAARGQAEQLTAFLNGIMAGTPPEVTVRDGARATIGCLRLLDAARNGLPAVIDLDLSLDSIKPVAEQS